MLFICFWVQAESCSDETKEKPNVQVALKILPNFERIDTLQATLLPKKNIVFGRTKLKPDETINASKDD